jgi:uncharacterized protein (DUF1501 family)
MTDWFLHPACPDRAALADDSAAPSPDDGVPRPRTAGELMRYGPNLSEAALRVHAEAVTAELAAQKEKWRHGFTRRRVVAGAGAVGVAAFASQLVTTRVAFGDPATTNRTLVVIFLRGGSDGLSIIVPGGDGNLAQARPSIMVPAAVLLPGGPNERRFGLHPVMQPIYPLWQAGKMAAVHAVASPDASRSHFQAQDCVERGAAATSVRTGWLDRVLAAMGPGTTFRAISEGAALQRSLVGGQSKIVLDGIQQFRLETAAAVHNRTLDALKGLYTGFDHPLAAQAQTTVQAVNAAQKIAKMPPNPAAQYPGGGFSEGLRDIARLIKAKVGLRVAAVDLGGWDMHTNVGTVNGGDMVNMLGQLSNALAAFTTDIGPDLLNSTNVVTISEFGRRVGQNGNNGLDHGHGGLVMLFGGGLNGGRVHGNWPGLSMGALDHGDLAGTNDYRSVLAEMLKTRFGIRDTATIFPGLTAKRIGAFQGA